MQLCCVYRCQWKAEVGGRSSGARITDSCEPSDIGGEGRGGEWRGGEGKRGQERNDKQDLAK